MSEGSRNSPLLLQSSSVSIIRPPVINAAGVVKLAVFNQFGSDPPSAAQGGGQRVIDRCGMITAGQEEERRLNRRRGNEEFGGNGDEGLVQTTIGSY